jgi:hypothetical protein
MNLLKKFIGGRVQLVSVANRIDQNGRLLEPIDDDWLLESVTDQGVRISNPRTGISRHSASIIFTNSRLIPSARAANRAMAS